MKLMILLGIILIIILYIIINKYFIKKTVENFTLGESIDNLVKSSMNILKKNINNVSNSLNNSESNISSNKGSVNITINGETFDTKNEEENSNEPAQYIKHTEEENESTHTEENESTHTKENESTHTEKNESTHTEENESTHTEKNRSNKKSSKKNLNCYVGSGNSKQYVKNLSGYSKFGCNLYDDYKKCKKCKKDGYKCAIYMTEQEDKTNGKWKKAGVQCSNECSSDFTCETPPDTGDTYSGFGCYNKDFSGDYLAPISPYDNNGQLCKYIH